MASAGDCALSVRGAPIMLKKLPIMLCRSARKRYLLCSTFVPIMLNFFNYAHKNIHNNSNFAMISVIQLVIIIIINFILLIFLNLMIKYYYYY